MESLCACEAATPNALATTASKPPPPRRNWLRLSLGLAVGGLVAAAACVFTGAHVHDVVRYATGVSPWLIAGCMASSFVDAALQSLRWHAVMQPVVGLRYREAYCARMLAFMFNAFLPGRGGDLLRVRWLARRTGVSRTLLLATEVIDRWIDCGGWVPVLLAVCVVGHPPSWLFRALGTFGSALLVSGALMLMLGRRAPAVGRHSRFARLCSAFQVGIGAFRAPRTWRIALFLAPLPWLWESLTIYWATRAFGIDIPWLAAFSVLVGLNLGTLVPSPGAIGAIEAGGTAALVFCGVDQSQALAFMCVYHFTQLVPGVLGGALCALVQRGKLL